MSNYLRILLIFCFLLFSTVFLTDSYFSDSYFATDNVISTIYWPTSILINEVYFNTGDRVFVQGNTSVAEREGYNEWIELYNPLSYRVNIKNYKVGNSATEFTINPDLWLEPGEFALLSHDNTTWHFWELTGSTKTVNLGGRVNGGWLKNEGDIIYLKNSEGQIISRLSYGNNRTIFDIVCEDDCRGRSLERYIAGADTGKGEDFIVRENPTPSF